MSDYTPTTDEVRECWAFRDPLATPDNHDAAEFDRWLAEHDREVKAEAWDEGHKHSWRRGPDKCQCYAHSWSECGCGKYGTGELLSLNDNPYR